MTSKDIAAVNIDRASWEIFAQEVLDNPNSSYHVYIGDDATVWASALEHHVKYAIENSLAYFPVPSRRTHLDLFANNDVDGLANTIKQIAIEKLEGLSENYFDRKKVEWCNKAYIDSFERQYDDLSELLKLF